MALGSIAAALDIAYRIQARTEAKRCAEKTAAEEARRIKDEQLEEERLAFMTAQLVRQTGR